MPAIPQTRKAPRKLVVAFSADERPSLTKLGEAVQDHLASHSFPDRVYLLGFTFNEEELQAACHAEEFRDRLPPLLRDEPDSVRHLSIARDGSLRLRLGDQLRTVEESFAKRICRAGLFHIFERHSGRLTSGKTFHYVKPSGAHCSSFLRTTQVLVHGDQIDFVASWILRYYGDELSEIWCDTAGISSIAYAVARLKRLLAPEVKHPIISSFSSYGGFEAAPLNPSSLVIISASMAGALAEKVRKAASLPDERVVTLYYLQDPPPSGTVLCDLTADFQQGIPGYALELNYSRDECPYCKDGSFPLRMKGEHFLPHETDVLKVLIRGRDAPQWLSPFVEDCHGRDVIRVHHRKGRRGLCMQILYFTQLSRLRSDLSAHLFSLFLPRLGRSSTFRMRAPRRWHHSLASCCGRLRVSPPRWYRLPACSNRRQRIGQQWEALS